jgi:FkbM family methyltransferase
MRIIEWRGNHIIFSAKGKARFLNFRFADSGMLKEIFNDIFINRCYFYDFGKGRKFSIEEGDEVIDIGANVGFFSVYAANIAGPGKVYAFEPVNGNFDRLIYYKNKYHLRNLIAYKNAVSDESKEAKIYLSRKNAGGHSFYKEKIACMENEGSESYETVKCFSLKEVFDSNGISNCDYLKIDAEGEEYSIIYSLPPGYFKRIKKIVLEYHPVEGRNAWDLADYLCGQNFAVYIFHWKKNFGRMFAYNKAA